MSTRELTDDEAEDIYVLYLGYLLHVPPMRAKERNMEAIRRILSRFGYDFTQPHTPTKANTGDQQIPETE